MIKFSIKYAGNASKSDLCVEEEIPVDGQLRREKV